MRLKARGDIAIPFLEMRVMMAELYEDVSLPPLAVKEGEEWDENGLGELAQPAGRGQTLEVVQALARLEIGSPRVHPDTTWEELAHLDRAS